MARRARESQVTKMMAARFVIHARRAGADVSEVVNRLGLPTTEQGWQTAQVPRPVFRELSQELARLTGDSFLGVHTALGLDRGSFGLVEYISRVSPTIRDAFERMVRFQRLWNDSVSFSMSELNGEATIDHRIPGEPLASGRHGNEFTMVALVSRARELSGMACPALRVWFVHAPPDDISGLVEFFGTDKIDFGATSNGFRLASAVMDAKVLTADAELQGLLERQAVAEVADRPQADDFLGQVKSRVKATLQEGGPNVERIAAGLKMSARTLQRRLEEQKTGFQSVVDEVRQTLGRLYIEDRSLKLDHVAYLLGYTDPRSFARAFKRWTGQSPEAYRGD